MSAKLPRVIWQDKIRDEIVRVIQQTGFDGSFPRFRFEVMVMTKKDGMGDSHFHWVVTQLDRDIAGRLATIYLQSICRQMDKSSQ